jgi:gliding motility-associated-like protein
MYIPTAFTPNNDGQNDEFKPVFNNLPDSYKILIFDRFGNIVFSSNIVNRGWNGEIEGKEPKQGIYQWRIVYQYKNNKPVEKTGHVKLLLK